MTGARIPAALRRLVRARAADRCEYCLLPGGVSFFPHEVGHVVARKHGGATVEETLARIATRRVQSPWGD